VVHVVRQRPTKLAQPSKRKLHLCLDARHADDSAIVRALGGEVQ